MTAQPIVNDNNSPELLLELECSEASVDLRKVEIKDFVEEWGEDKQKAVKLRLEFECADDQIIPTEYKAAVRDLREVSHRGPEDKSNSVKMTIKHDCKRGTYKLQRKKKAPLIKFSGIPSNPKITVNREKVSLKWKIETTVPAGRLLDLVAMLIADDVIVTIENLQPDMWSH